LSVKARTAHSLVRWHLFKKTTMTRPEMIDFIKD